MFSFQWASFKAWFYSNEKESADNVGNKKITFFNPRDGNAIKIIHYKTQRRENKLQFHELLFYIDILNAMRTEEIVLSGGINIGFDAIIWLLYRSGKKNWFVFINVVEKICTCFNTSR